MSVSLKIFLVPNIPDIQFGDKLEGIIGDNLHKSSIGLRNGDILCIAHKVVSKAEGCLVDLENIIPSNTANLYAKELNKDPRKVQVILNESKKVIRSFKHSKQNEGVMICEHNLGFISANAAVDESNVGKTSKVITLPKNPDKSARYINKKLDARFGVKIGVLITDTFGRPWRIGQVNVCVGISGIPVTKKEQGMKDAWGRRLYVSEPAFADEIAAASGLVMFKSAKTPVVLFRGLEWERGSSVISDILRNENEDMFR